MKDREMTGGWLASEAWEAGVRQEARSGVEEERERAVFLRSTRAVDDLEIRREDMRDVVRLGTVRWWKADKGYGRVAADDGEVWWAGFGTLVKNGPRELQPGQRVVFVWRGGFVDHRRHVADEVRIIGEVCPLPEDEAGPLLPPRPPAPGEPTDEEIQAAIDTLAKVGFDLAYIR